MSVVTVVPTVEPSTGPTDPPRIRLNVTDTGSPAITSANVFRQNPDGRTVPVRTFDGNPLILTTSGSNRVGLLYDYEAPLGEAVSYSTAESPGTVSAQVTMDDPSIWLVHVGVPELSMAVELRAGSFAEEEWDVRQGVHWPIGRDTPVVQTDGARRAPSSSLTVAVELASDMWALRDLLRDAGPLLLNVPVSMGLGVETSYIAVGAVRNRRPSDIGGDPMRALELPYQVVDRPAGGSQAERNFADVVADNATYADLTAKYGTFFDLLVGP